VAACCQQTKGRASDAKKEQAVDGTDQGAGLAWRTLPPDSAGHGACHGEPGSTASRPTAFPGKMPDEAAECSAEQPEEAAARQHANERHSLFVHTKTPGEIMPEIYVSTDVETDGPIPGPHSMLSFGSAAYLADKTLLGTFAANLQTLPGAVGHPETMAWWHSQPDAWADARQNLRDPQEAMPAYRDWLKSLPGKPVFVAYPAGFDFLFVYWYLIRFADESPFSFSALDMKTFAMCLLQGDYRNATKRNMPRRWFDDLPHTHRALDDAIEQGALFCNMLRENREARSRT
jgi:hypothetical protein